ncbi:substrate-binding periplasmic protein [Alkalispirochaeta alkalica]|uniref:substrate-binding periplasmic protein n=1 Tax=Alkalispirochaeta alkalica TaxID=46356 RepID=UPI000368C48A|nr:transporter substrate-binding domain-containing protein [Alkalispirochaeta alkalica]
MRKNRLAWLGLLFLLVGLPAREDAGAEHFRPLPAPDSVPSFAIFSEEWNPFNFTEDGEARGISVELLELLLKSLGSDQTREDIRFHPWARAFFMAREQPRSLIFTTMRTTEREDLFQWVGPVFIHKTELFARRDRAISLEKLNDAREYTITTYIDGAPERLLLERGILLEEIDRVSTQEIAFLKILHNRADLIPTSKLSLVILCRQAGVSPGIFESVQEIARRGMYFAFSLDTPRWVITELQRNLDNLHRRGLVAELFADHDIAGVYDIRDILAH